MLTFLSFLGWFTFLVGSVIGSPFFGIRDDRDKVYIASTSVLFSISLLFCGKYLVADGANIWYNISRFKEFIIASGLHALGMILFHFGSFVFLKSSFNPTLSVVGVPFYVFGSLALLISSLYYWGINSMTGINKDF